MPNAILTKCSDANYALIDAINYSSFKHFLISPKHYKEYISCEHEETPAMRLGTAIHSAVLTPSQFSKSYIKAPVCDRRTREGKLEWQDFISLHGDKKILTDDDFSTCISIQRAFEANEFFQKLFNGNKNVEQVVVGELFGVAVKGRIDMYDERTNTIYDVKSIASVPSVYNCQKAIHQNLSYTQAYMYSMLIKQVYNVSTPTFVFGFVEKAKPNSIGHVIPSEYFMNYASSIVEKELNRFQNCSLVNAWPSFTHSDVPAIVSPFDVETSSANHIID